MGQQVITLAGAVLAIIGSVGGGYAWIDHKLNELDTKHVQVAEYQDFQWSVLKQQLRDLRQQIREWEMTGTVPHELQRDYEELLDLFCRRYKEDRECRR
jgi:hypothetical protein